MWVRERERGSGGEGGQTERDVRKKGKAMGEFNLSLYSRIMVQCLKVKKKRKGNVWQ